MKVAVCGRGDMEELLGEGKVENGLLFVQRLLQSGHKLKEWSLKINKKDHMKIISVVVLSVRANNMRVMECEQVLVEVGKLEDSM